MSYNPQFSKLGEILVNENFITEAELEKALTQQKTKKDKLGNIWIVNPYCERYGNLLAIQS